MMKQMKTENGFTLIELMIVIAIIGILAAVALPRFSNSTEKARYAEAKLAFRAIAVATEAYYAEHGIYPDELGVLLLDPITKKTGILGNSIPYDGITTLRPNGKKKGYIITYEKDKAKYTYTKDENGKVTIKKS